MKHIFWISLLFFTCGLYGVYAAEDATLSLSSTKTSYTLGEDISVKIVVSSPTQEINAVSGAISFPATSLKVKSIDKGGSIVSLWAEEPSFDNSAGTIQFEGVIFNPVFTGDNGTVLTLHFESKTSGSATLQFTSGSALANDGIGTNILDTTSGVDFTLGDTTKKVIEEVEKEVIVETNKPKSITPTPTPAPTITPSKTGLVVQSPTHPDNARWYANNNPQFTWDIPVSVIAVAFSIDKDSGGSPGVSKGSVATHTFNGVEDGKWYFHIQGKTKSGWGPTTHFPFNVDTGYPEKPHISEVIKKNIIQGDWTFKFLSNDSLSGVDRYEIFVDNEKGEIQQGGGEHTYHIGGLFPGMHSLVIRAIDHAGNTSLETMKFGDIEGWSWIHIRNIIAGCVFLVILFFFFKNRKKHMHPIVEE